MTGFDAISAARFQTMVEAEQRWAREQIALLWQHMGKRRDEIAMADERLSDEIKAINLSINAAIRWAMLAFGGVLFSVVRAKLGL